MCASQILFCFCIAAGPDCLIASLIQFSRAFFKGLQVSLGFSTSGALLLAPGHKLCKVIQRICCDCSHRKDAPNSQTKTTLHPLNTLYNFLCALFHLFTFEQEASSVIVTLLLLLPNPSRRKPPSGRTLMVTWMAWRPMGCWWCTRGAGSQRSRSRECGGRSLCVETFTPWGRRARPRPEESWWGAELTHTLILSHTHLSHTHLSLTHPLSHSSSVCCSLNKHQS